MRGVGCTLEQARAIVELRPFSSEEDLRAKLGQGKKKAGPSGISPRVFEDSIVVFEAYSIVDAIVSTCEAIGEKLKQEIAKWTSSIDSKGKGKDVAMFLGEGGAADNDEGALTLSSRAALAADMPDYYISSQPASLSPDVQLKEYQLVGINWMNLLYKERHNCILADEMGVCFVLLVHFRRSNHISFVGLGKTVQVISFFAHLKDQGSYGPHLIVVP